MLVGTALNVILYSPFSLMVVSTPLNSAAYCGPFVISIVDFLAKCVNPPRIIASLASPFKKATRTVSPALASKALTGSGLSSNL
jgi:hypothetical protein